MAGQSLRAATSSVCAYCGAPLAMAAQDLKAWRVGAQFVCNEFCADGIPLHRDNDERAAWLANEMPRFSQMRCGSY
jgi:hypothetical protein